MRILRASGLPILLPLALLVSSCTAPRPEPMAASATSLVADRTGVAPRWRAGEPAGSGEEARMRDLLARPLGERNAVDVALVRNRGLQALVEEALAGAYAAGAEAEPGNPVADLVLRWPPGGGGPAIAAGRAFGLLALLRPPGRRAGGDLAARGAALEAAEGMVGILTEVRSAWIEAVAAGQEAALEETVAEAASIAADLAERQVAAGTLSALDADRHRAVRDEAFLALERSRAAAAAARERLLRALGLFGKEAAILLPAELPPLPAAEDPATSGEAAVVTRRLDLERARVAVLEARLAAGLAADARLLPDLEAGVHFEQDHDGDRSTGPGISVALPLSGREASLEAAALARARAAEDLLHALAVRVRSEAREAAAALSAARSAAALYGEAILPRRAAMVEEAQLRYNGMLIGVHELLAEKREELMARREGVEALRDYWLARLRFEEVLGGGTVPAAADVPAATAGPAAVPAKEPEYPHRGHDHGGGK